LEGLNELISNAYQGVKVDEVDLEGQAVERGSATAERVHVYDALFIV
jgi:hypothetical protein